MTQNNEFVEAVDVVAGEDAPISMEEMPSLVIITGMSGAGRTEAMHVFEDLGYFCVDNLPAPLIPNLLDLRSQSGDDNNQTPVAVVCDARNHLYFDALVDKLQELESKNQEYRMVFLDASDAKLVARYKSSRRRHPLCDDGASISQGISRERAKLAPYQKAADFVIDTTDMLPQQLRTQLRSLFTHGETRKVLSVSVYSFGFKHAEPSDADLVIDVRFLPNPYYVEELRPLTGLDEAVRAYVMDNPDTALFKQRWFALLDCGMPGYVEEGKQQLAIAVGCTGGQHRSVALAEATGEYLKQCGYRVSVAHRDLTLAEGASAKER